MEKTQSLLSCLQFLLLPFNLPAVPLFGQILPEQLDTGVQRMKPRVVSYFEVKSRESRGKVRNGSEGNRSGLAQVIVLP